MNRLVSVYATAFFALFSTSALAQTAPTDQFVSAFRDSASAAGLSLSWATETPNADGLVLGQVELGDARTGRVFVVERIMVEGISVDKDGRAVARRLVVSDEIIDVEGKGIGTGIDVAVNGLVFEGVATPAPGSAMLRDIAVHYDRMALGNLQVMINGATLARFDNAFTTAEWKADERLSFTGGIGSFSIFATEIPWFLQLGYPTVSGSAAMTGHWTVADGRMSVKSTLDVVQAFGIEASIDLSGYSRELYAAAASPRASAETMTFSLMAMSLDAAKLAYQDKSFVNRALDLAAVTKGRPVEAVIEEITRPIATQASAFHEDPAKGTALLETIRAFLADPGSLTLALAPKTPVSIIEMGARIPYPGDRLGVTLTRK